MDENYRRMWNIKFDIYKKDETEENFEALKEVAVKRIDWGNKFLKDFAKPNWPFPKFWTRLDLIKCHLQVIMDRIDAEKCAEDLYKELQDKSTDILFFNDISGIDFDRKMSMQNFVKIIIEKFK